MTVTVPVPLTEEEQSALSAQAEAEGVSVDSLLRKAVLQVIAAAHTARPSTNSAQRTLKRPSRRWLR
jgi:hypothetical protein